MLAYRNPDRKKYKALDHRTIRCTIESYGDTGIYGTRSRAAVFTSLARSTATVTDSLAVYSAGARVHMLRNLHAAYAASRSLSLCTNQI